MPSSAFLVLRSLQRTGPMSPKEISERIQIPARTVSFAIRKLSRHRLIRKVPDLTDMRRCVYTPNLDVAREIVMKYGPDSMIGSQLTMILTR
ncbi:MAG: MarR family transcriptional regulator [Candidatus Hodarchaeota archaeon]